MNPVYDNALISVSPDEKDNVALTVSKSVDYFPRLKLCQSNAKEVNGRKVARGGNYALISSKEDITDLGDELTIIICAGRAKALRTGDTIMSIFEPEDDEFKKIQDESSDKDSGCMYGPEYLVWLPDQDTFATFFLNSPTARRESSAVHSRLGKGALLTSHLIERPKFSWFGPKCGDLTTPITNIPDQESLDASVNKFRNEKSSRVQSVDEDTETRER